MQYHTYKTGSLSNFLQIKNDCGFCRKLLDLFVVSYIARNRKREEEIIMDRFTKKILMAIGIYAVFAIAFIILFQTVFMLSLVPSESMENTIMPGDIVISTRTDIKEEDIERFDILVFIPPDEPDITYIKRVIGLPGETIEVKDGKVYADGAELDSSFINETQNKIGDGIYEIPEGCYFFMGDNRNNSKDSRFWEDPYVPVDDIQAKAKCIIFPFSDAGSLSYN